MASDRSDLHTLKAAFLAETARFDARIRHPLKPTPYIIRRIDARDAVIECDACHGWGFDRRDMLANCEDACPECNGRGEKVIECPEDDEWLAGREAVGS